MIGITGASGYLGRALATSLASHMLPVVTLGRGDADRALDLGQHTGFRSALEGLSTLVHCAGLAHNRSAPHHYERINHRATMALADAAATAGVRRFIFISTLNVVPAASASGSLSAASLPRPSTAYAESKWLAEQSLEQLLGHSDCDVVICRPGLIYDHQLTGNLATLRHFAGRLPIAFPEKGERGMISRPDLVALLHNLIQRETWGQLPSRNLPVTDGESYSARRIARALGCAAGLSIPAPLWRVGGWCRDRLTSAVPGSTWRAVSGEGWTGAAPVIDGWQPRWTLETLLTDNIEGLSA